MRRSLWLTLRSSPVRPISPNTTVSSRTGGVLQAGNQRNGHSQVHRGLVQPQAPYHVYVGVPGWKSKTPPASPAPPESGPCGCSRSRWTSAGACRSQRWWPGPGFPPARAGCPPSPRVTQEPATSLGRPESMALRGILHLLQSPGPPCRTRRSRWWSRTGFFTARRIR